MIDFDDPNLNWNILKEDDRLVTYQDARSLKYCNRGIRQLCSSLGWDYSYFRAHGFMASKAIEHHDNPYVIALLKKVYADVDGK